MHPSCCAIIPARGGSKGIVGKNLRVLGGLPLIGHTIVSATQASSVDRVVVSTDDPRIARVAEEMQARVVRRPAELATDEASSESALLHALGALRREEQYEPDVLVFLQCTSPLTRPEDIDGTVRALLEAQADTALTVARFHHFLWKVDGGRAAGINHDEAVRARRQDREPQYVETGAVYAMRVPGFLSAKHRFFGKTVVFETPPERAVEIDEPFDLDVAGVLFEALERTRRAARLPSPVAGLVMDFDGVLTDNLVRTDENGVESVSCSRGDGMGIELLQRASLPMLVISKETNPVVQARCRKMKIPCRSAVEGKARVFEDFCKEHGIDASQVVYVGNDVNDLDCMAAAGCSVAVADAHPDVLRAAHLTLSRAGGRGAIRELADLILRARGAEDGAG